MARKSLSSTLNFSTDEVFLCLTITACRHVVLHDQPFIHNEHSREVSSSPLSLLTCQVSKSSLAHTQCATVNAVPTRLLSGNSNPSKNPSTGQYGVKQTDPIPHHQPPPPQAKLIQNVVAEQALSTRPTHLDRKKRSSI